LEVDPSTTLTNYQVIPLRLEFHGNFYAIADFLFRLRNLVDVRRGALDAHGRLFAIDKLALDEGVYVFPEIRAEITVVAFVYGAGVPATAAPPQSSSAASPTGTTTTTTATTTAPASSAAPNATAAGATP
jgi:hypothetical protein